MINMTEEEMKEVKGRLIAFISRKFIMALMVLIASTTMVIVGELDAKIWLGIVVSELLSYNYANAKSKG
jgi:phenylpyruvate tautomerase PptA (4-oxalocrotonate tautomerase family)